MIRIKNVCGKAILMCLIPILEGVIYDSITPIKGLAPIDKVKEVLIHLRFKIVHRYQDTVTKNLRNKANSTDPDETSHLGLRYL